MSTNPIEKVNLYVPIESWSEIITTLDKKVEFICEKYGHGKVTLAITIAYGKVVDTVYMDEIRMRGVIPNASQKDDKNKK